MGIALATLAESMPQFALLLVLTLLPLQLVSGPANSSVSSQAGSRKWDRRPFRRWTPSVLGLPPLAARAHEGSAQDKHSGSPGRPWPAAAEAPAVEEPMSRAAFGAVKPKDKAKTMEPT